METLRSIDWASILVPILTLLLPIIIGAVTTLVVRLIKKAGLDIDDVAAKRVQDALTQGALVALAHARSSPATQVATAIAAKPGVDYVKGAVPDSVKRLGLTDDQIRVRLLPRIEDQIRRTMTIDKTPLPITLESTIPVAAARGDGSGSTPPV